ncbi:MAG: Nitronate monooxygenase [Elusimicrobia bacterium ADurb.Bin231]|nr:MAG: Nitronate monooxygenase [Elusimicrobia bacterium ADurb.Bin231]
MDKKTMPCLKIGKVEVRVPIVQGGMSVGISLSGLASAVATAGGIGVIGTAGIGMLEPDFNTHFSEANKRALRKEIKKTRSLTSGIIGVNIMVALSDFDDLVLAAVEEGIDFIFVGAGLPLKKPKTLSQDQLMVYARKMVPIVSSGRAAKIIFQHWIKEYGTVPDAVIVEGPLAGGHLGFKKDAIDNPDYALENILAEVISSVKPFEEKFQKKIPVIAGGGIYTGQDIRKFIGMGASGVQMATRFVATHECDASDKFKEMYLKCKKEDLIIINSPVGLPGRAIRNQFLTDVSGGIKKPFKCFWKCLKTCDFKTAPYCIGLALTNAKRGLTEEGFCFAGANAYRVDRLMSVKELIDSLGDEYESAQ